MMFIRIASLVLGIVLQLYWFIMAWRAARNKPKTHKNIYTGEKIIIYMLSFFVALNLLGFRWMPFENVPVHFIGFCIACFGFTECMIARHNLLDNWTNSYEYQIKEKHELITKGIYKYVRHPIYGGMWLMSIGMLLVAGTYLVIGVAPLIFGAIFIFAKREEALLTKTFGDTYHAYMRSSKRFIPFVF